MFGGGVSGLFSNSNIARPVFFRYPINEIMSGEFFDAEKIYLAVTQKFLEELSYADWSDPLGVIRFRADLKLEELQKVPFLVNTRVFLKALAERKGAEMTATGNLNRAFVGVMFDQFLLPQSTREMTHRYCKVLNEMDLWHLHLVRIVCEIAGLVKRRKKRFYLTPRGRELLPDDKAGTLYRSLFLAYFMKFDLHYDFPLREAKWIQPTMAATLWRLDSVIENWRSVRGLAPQVLLPKVYENLRSAMINPHDKEEWIFSGYVLQPLIKFGLVEDQKAQGWEHREPEENVRLTPLWKRFIAFGDEPNLGHN